MTLRVLLLSQYYHPEIGATQTRMRHFARHLATAGHDVAVVGELPNHPKGEIFDGWSGKVFDRRHEDGADVVRVWVYTSTKKSFWRRIAFYLTYMVNAAVASLLVVRRRPDVILATSPPLPVLLAARALSAAYRRPYVADIRDIWPAVGVALGELRGERVVAAAQRIERALYRRAAAITVVTEGFADHVRRQGTDPGKVHLVPNGTLPEVFTPDRTDPETRARLGLEGKFVVGFFGNHGIAQGLPAILEAARLLSDRGNIHFLLVGEGPVKTELVRKAKRHGLGNMTFLPQVPIDDVTPYINSCDVLLVPLRKLEILDTFVPSKLFDFLACSRPVVLMVDGEARKILEATGGGVFVEPENVEELCATLNRLSHKRDWLAEAGRRGRAYVLKHHTRDTQAHMMENVLLGVASLTKR